MAQKLTFEHDADGDILLISQAPPYPERETGELGDDVIARMNPRTHEIEHLEVLSWSSRLEGGGVFELPVSAILRLAS